MEITERNPQALDYVFTLMCSLYVSGQNSHSQCSETVKDAIQGLWTYLY